MRKSRKRRNTLVVVAGILLAAILVGIGTVTGMLFASRASQNQRSRPAAARPDDRGQLQDPLLKELDQVLGQAEELEDQDLREARRILHEADSILTQAREENRRALEMANQPPVIGPPHARRPSEKSQPPAEAAPAPKAP